MLIHHTLAGWAEVNYKWAASYERASTRGGRKMWRKVLKRNKRLLSQWLHVVEVDNNRRKHCKRWWLQPRHLESSFSFLLAIKGFGKIVKPYKWHDCINYKAFIPTETDLHHFKRWLGSVGLLKMFLYLMVLNDVQVIRVVQWWWWYR